jgi:hypothetical protein
MMMMMMMYTMLSIILSINSVDCSQSYHSVIKKARSYVGICEIVRQLMDTFKCIYENIGSGIQTKETA